MKPSQPKQLLLFQVEFLLGDNAAVQQLLEFKYLVCGGYAAPALRGRVCRVRLGDYRKRRQRPGPGGSYGFQSYVNQDASGPRLKRGGLSAAYSSFFFGSTAQTPLRQAPHLVQSRAQPRRRFCCKLRTAKTSQNTRPIINSISSHIQITKSPI